MLEAAQQHHSELVRLTNAAVAASASAWRTGRLRSLPGALAVVMAAAGRNGAESVPAMLSEQGMEAPAEARVVPQAFGVTATDGRPLASLLEQATDLLALQTMVVTQVADADRFGATVGTVVRPSVSGYVRYVGGTCCSRCAILAGRFYRWSNGFKRHPRCMCVHVPTTTGGAAELIDSPDDLFRQGRITDLTGAEVEAVKNGADLGRVVNATKRPDAMYTAEGGLTFTTEAATRASRRLTPESINRLASDRAEAIELLSRNGYIV